MCLTCTGHRYDTDAISADNKDLLRDASGHQVDWTDHVWESFDQYHQVTTPHLSTRDRVSPSTIQAKNAAIDKEIADTVKMLKRLHDCSEALVRTIRTDSQITRPPVICIGCLWRAYHGTGSLSHALTLA